MGNRSSLLFFTRFTCCIDSQGMKEKIILIVYALLFPFFLNAQEIGIPFVANYTLDKLGKDIINQVRCIAQDDNGILYLGAYCLIEYDGVSLRTIKNSQNILAYDLKKGVDGKVYVGADDDFGFIEKDKDGYSYFKSLRYLLPDTTAKLGLVYSINLTNNTIFFSATHSLIQYSYKTNEAILISHKEEGEEEYLIGGFADKDTFYFRSTLKGPKKVSHEQAVKQINTITFGQSDNFLNVAKFDDSTFVVPTYANGLKLYNPKTSELPKNYVLNNSSFTDDNQLYRISNQGANNFIIGSLGKGSVLFNKQAQVLQQFNMEMGLSDNEHLFNFTDANGNIWLTYQKGFSKTEHGLDISYWDKSNGLNSIVLSMERFKGYLYVGTSTKAFFIDKDNTLKEVKNLPIGYISCLLGTKQKLLAGTVAGIYEIRGNSSIKIFDGAQAADIYQSRIDTNRYFSTNGNFLISFRWNSGKWLYEGIWKGIEDNIQQITEDKKGNLWLETYSNGIIKVVPDKNAITTPKKVQYYNDLNGISTQKLIGLNYFKGKIIIGTNEGLRYYNELADSFEQYCDLGEQFCNGENYIWHVDETPDNKIWLVHFYNNNTGFLQPNKNGGYDFIHKPFRRLPTMHVYSSLIEKTGVIWIGSDKGLFKYDIKEDKRDYNQSFKCLIRNVTCAKDSILPVHNDNEVDEGSVLNYAFNSIKFAFAAPFFDSEEKTFYSYKLEGLDTEWSEWSRQTEKDYSYLPEGKYKFMVKARNIYDVESPVASYKITVLPPFYRTWLAYLIYFLIGSFILTILFRLNSLRLTKEKKRLEKLVKQRTEEIEMQKEKLEIANATKDKFFKIISHDLRNPFNSLVGFSELLIEEIEQKDLEKSKEYAELLQKSSNELYGLTTNLLSWGRAQSNEITFNPEQLNIRTEINSNINILKSLADKKGIILHSKAERDIFIFADQNMLNSILRNLITNAIKFSGKDDKIILEVEELEKEVAIHVSDTGIGMGKATLEKLFKIGENNKSEGTAHEPGTGLGLILCKEFIEKHKGRIWVESEKGKGSRFSFTMPRVHISA